VDERRRGEEDPGPLRRARPRVADRAQGPAPPAVDRGRPALRRARPALARLEPLGRGAGGGPGVDPHAVRRDRPAGGGRDPRRGRGRDRVLGSHRHRDRRRGAPADEHDRRAGPGGRGRGVPRRPRPLADELHLRRARPPHRRPAGPQQSRSFLYDSLGRLREAGNPESGVVRYDYDRSGLLVWRRDARGVETSHAYDGLGPRAAPRLHGRHAGGGFAWDDDPGGVLAASPWSAGRLVSVDNGVSRSEWRHGPHGHVESSLQRTAGQAFRFDYVTDFAGNVLEQRYPSGRMVATEVDKLDRVTLGGGRGGPRSLGRLLHAPRRGHVAAPGQRPRRDHPLQPAAPAGAGGGGQPHEPPAPPLARLPLLAGGRPRAAQRRQRLAPAGGGGGPPDGARHPHRALRLRRHEPPGSGRARRARGPSTTATTAGATGR
jgi:hypothetical protein